MVKLVPPPASVQDKAVYDYLYQLQEYLGMILDGVQEPGGIAQVASKEASKEVSATLGDQVEYLKAMIIKTAEVIESHTSIDLSGLKDMIAELGDVIEGDDGLRVQLLNIQNEFAAYSSQFGDYQKTIEQILSASAEGLEQKISIIENLVSRVDTDFKNWLMQSSGFIRFGIVGERDDEYHTPIIGIAVGQDLTVRVNAETGEEETQEINGVEYKIIEKTGFRAIYAADELSFWLGETKVAYMSNNQLVVTDIVALSRFRLGNWSVTDGSKGLVVKWEG